MIEFFEMIWRILTTESKIIITVISIPFTFIEVYISMLIFTVILNITATKKQKLCYVLGVGSFIIFSNYFIPSPYSTYLNIIAFLLGNLFILKATIFKGILILIIPFIITIILESIVVNCYNLIFHSDYYLNNNIPIYRIVISLIIYLIEYLIYFAIKKFKISFSKIQIINKKTKVLLTLTSILAIALISGQVYILFFYSYIMPLFISLLNIIGLITYFFLNLYTTYSIEIRNYFYKFRRSKTL